MRTKSIHTLLTYQESIFYASDYLNLKSLSKANGKNNVAVFKC